MRLNIQRHKHLFFPLVLVVISIILCVQNYTPSTFLSGWDTLHPEFDFALNLQRTFFGVFRTEQGLGAVAAHAHMVEMPRIAILYLLNFVFPLSMLRYLYVFMCIIAGPLGMYFFLQQILIKKPLPSFLGALFYLLNLGTYQTFVVPFEMFTTLFAMLPFVFLTFSQYLKKPSKKLLILTSLVIIFTAPSAYASTLWFVFFASLLVFFIPFIFFQKNKRILFKRFSILIGITIILNLYWLLPNIYFAITQGANVANANINKLFSGEAFLKNKEFGNIKDILTLKSFYFDWGIYNYKTSSFEQLTLVFQNHLSKPFINALSYAFASLFVVGLFYSFKKAKHYLASFLLLLLFCLFFLFNINGPLGILFLFFQNHLPLFREALRFPDDKILNIFVFLYSIFFAYAILFLTSLSKKRIFKLFLASFFGILISVLLIIYMLPAFQGNFIHPEMRVTIPLEYFDLFNTLKKEPAGRVATFPVASPWGWAYYNWYGNKAPSFQGAGFLYFGIPQSLLDRDFDRWNPLNEQYYREISHALYSQNETEVKNVIKKYNITQLLLDTSIVSPGNNAKILDYDNTKIIFGKLLKEGFLKDKKEFGSFLTLYEIANAKPLLSTIRQSYKIENSNSNAYYTDFAYQKLGNYLQSPNDKSTSSTFPLTNFFDNQSKVNQNIISLSNNELSFSLPKNIYTLLDTNPQKNIVPANILATLANNEGQSTLTVNLYPQTILFDNNSLLNPIKGEFAFPNNLNAYLSVNNQVFSLANLNDNASTLLGTAFLNESQNTIALFDKSSNNQNSETYPISNVPLSFGYCNQTLNNSDINVVARPNSLSITRPQKDSVCMSLPLSFLNFINNSQTLVDISLSSKSSSKMAACLTNPTTNQCDKYLDILNNGSELNILFSVNNKNASSQRLILTVDKGTQTQTLSGISIKSFSSLSDATIDSSFFKTNLPTSFKKVKVPKNIDKNYYYAANNNADLKNDCQNPTNIAKKQIIKNNSQTYYRYTSTIGSFCDHFSFPNLPHAFSYLVYINAKNIEGLPMNLCITNYTTRRCDIYENLTKDKTTNVFFLPQSDPDGVGYDINIENEGILKSRGVNNFYSATFVPIPYTLLSQIVSTKIQRNSYPGITNSTIFYNPLLITTSTSKNPTLVSLSYAYNSGFKAYKTNCNQGFLCSLSLLIRPLFGNSYPHYELNSWENAWVVSSQSNSNLSFPTSHLLIIYLPQYLEYAGILVLIIFITFLVVYSLANKMLKNNLDDYFEKKTRQLKNKIKSLI